MSAPNTTAGMSMTAPTVMPPLERRGALDDRLVRSRPLGEVRPVAGEPSRLPSAEGSVVFLCAFALFGFAAYRMGIVYAALPGDAVSRTAAASAALWSRDPKLESLGFVWPPFPALFEIPLVWLGRWWPPLLRDAMAGPLVSALSMAGLVAVARAWFEDLGLGRALRLTLVALLALHPLILLYGANGMSEAGLLLFLMVAARRTALWLERQRPLDLVAASAALGMAYLHRYEAAAAAVALVALVSLHVASATTGPWKVRARAALLPATVAAVPAFGAMVVWAFVSWAITGEPLAQFSSKYGNSAQVRAAARFIAESAGAVDGLPRAVYFGKQLLLFAALAPLLLVILYWFGTRGGLRTASAACMFGAPLAFQLASAVAGSSYQWGRYVICAVVLGFLLIGPLVVSAGPPSSRGRRLVAGLSVVAAAAFVGVSVAGVRAGALDTREEAWELSTLPLGPLRPDRVVALPSLTTVGNAVASEIERLNPGPGQVLLDTSNSFAVVLNARDQRWFVIPADRDFERILSAPAAFGVRYVVVPRRSTLYDAVIEAFPQLKDDGGTFARRVRTVEPPGGVGYTYDIFELTGSDR